MRRTFPALTVLLFVLSSQFSVLSFQGSAGPLVVVGGGETNPAIVARTLELAGGRNTAIVAVLAQSSELPDAGDSSVEMWKKAGARDAVNVHFGDRAAARRAIETATLIWMPAAIRIAS